MGKPLTLRLTFVGACFIALVQSSIITKPSICPSSPALSPYNDVDISDHDLESLRSNICNNNKILVCLSKIIEAIKRREQNSDVIVRPCGCSKTVHPITKYNHRHEGPNGDHHVVDHHSIDHHLEDHGEHHLIDHGDLHLADHGVHHLVDHVDHHLADHGVHHLVDHVDHHLLHHGEVAQHMDHHLLAEQNGGYHQQVHHEGHGDHQLVHHGQHHQAHYDEQHGHLHQVHKDHHEAHNIDKGEYHNTHHRENIHAQHEGKNQVEKTIEKTTSHVTEQSKSKATEIDISSKDIHESFGNQKIHVDHSSESSEHKNGHFNLETATKHDKSYSSNHKDIDESSLSTNVHSETIEDKTKVHSGHVTEVSTEHKDVSIEKTKVKEVKHIDISEATVSHSDRSSSGFGAVEAHGDKSITVHDTTIGIGHHGHQQNVDFHEYQEHVDHHGHGQHVDYHDHHLDHHDHHLDQHGHEHNHHLNLHDHHHEGHEGGHQEYYSNDQHGSSVITDSGVSTIGGELQVTHVVGEYKVPEIIIHDSPRPDAEIPSQHTHIDYVDQGNVPIVSDINQQPNQPIYYPNYGFPSFIPGPVSGPPYPQTGIVTADTAQQYLKPNFWEYPYPWFLYSSFPPVHPSGNIHHEFLVHRNCSHEHKFPVYHGIPDQHIWTGDCFENTRSLILSPPCNQDINCQKITRHVSHNLGGAGTTNSKCVTNIVSKQFKN